MSARRISLEQAKAMYPHRFTMEHKPRWANEQRPDGTFYAPHYRTDAEWYERTMFPGEGYIKRREKYCYSTAQSWPLGQALSLPYQVRS